MGTLLPTQPGQLRRPLSPPNIIPPRKLRLDRAKRAISHPRRRRYHLNQRVSTHHLLRYLGTSFNFASLKTNEEKVRVMQRMEEQVKILNKYIRELAKENEMLQDKNNDMRTTLTQNKQLLGTHPPSRLLQEYR